MAISDSRSATLHDDNLGIPSELKYEMIEKLAQYFFPQLRVDTCLQHLMRANLVRSDDRETYKISSLDQQYAYQRIPREKSDDPNNFNLLSVHDQASIFYSSITKKINFWKNIEDAEPFLQQIQHLLLAEKYHEASEIFKRFNDADFDKLAVSGYSKYVSEVRELIQEKLKTSAENEILNSVMLGHSRIRDCEIKKAYAAYERALNLYEKNFSGQELYPKFDILGNIGRTQLLNGEVAKAMENFTKVINKSAQVSGSVKDDDWKKEEGQLDYILVDGWRLRKGEAEHWLVRMGQAKRLIGAYEEATDLFNKALKVLEAFKNDRWTVLGFSDLGEKQLLTDDQDNAMKSFEKALHYAKKSSNVFGIAYCKFRIGTIKHLKKMYMEARKLYLEAVEKSIKSVQFSTYFHLGLTYLHDEKPDIQTANKYFKQGLSFCKEILDGSPDYLDVKIHQAFGLMLLRDEEASEKYEEIYRICIENNLIGAFDVVQLHFQMVFLLPSNLQPPNSLNYKNDFIAKRAQLKK